MAEVAGESWWIKLGVMYDKSGFKAAIVGMTDIKKIAEGLASTFKKVVDANSDLYLASHSLNMSTRDLQVWERTFKLVGGTAEEARATISGLNYTYNELLLGMSGEKATAAARLHLMPDDLLSMETTMEALNRSFNTTFKRDRGFFTPLVKQLGLSNSAIELVTLSMEEYQSKVRKASSIPIIPQSQIKAARDLKEQFAQLSIQWDNFKSSVISSSFPAVSKFFKDIGKILSDKEFKKNLTEFFTTLEEGFNRFITDVDHQQMIKDMTTISKAILEVAKWTARGIGGTVNKTEQIASGLGSATNRWFGDKELQKAIEENAKRQGKEFMKNVSLVPAVAGAGGMGLAGGISPVNNSIGQVTINVNGSGDPDATADAIQQRLRSLQQQENTSPL